MKITKIKLTPAIEKRVRASREKLNAALAKFDAIVATGETIADKLTKLDSQIADGESKLDVLDDDQCLRLQAKKSQREAVLKKLVALGLDIEAAEKVIHGLLDESVRATGDAHMIELEAVRAEAQAAVQPFFGTNERAAREAVEQFFFVRQLWHFCGNVGMGTPSVEHARRLLAMLDGLLLGKSGFVFTPE